MKNKIILNLLFAIGCISAQADIVIPGANGTDGALNITADTVIDLSQAPTGTWDQDNSENAGKGVYDPEKWAVVFKYTGINIAAGAKVTFKNSASRAPVVWLVSGDVTIAGTVDLSGSNAIVYGSLGNQTEPRIPDGGPGGFRGGSGGYKDHSLNSTGFGPGGGVDSDLSGLGGAFGTTGYNSIKTYGNPSLIPLIGGSGGGGSMSYGMWQGFGSSASGGGGGGAILLAAAGKVELVNGRVVADGGNGLSGGDFRSGGGSGGGIRIVCNEFAGIGNVTAVGGLQNSAGNGRIRLENVTLSDALVISPAPSSVKIEASSTPDIWPPDSLSRTSPSARIISINGTIAPMDPSANLGAGPPDVSIPMTEDVVVLVETKHVEDASRVFVRISPRNGKFTNGNRDSGVKEVQANLKEKLPGEDGISIWSASIKVLPGYSALQARVIRP